MIHVVLIKYCVQEKNCIELPCMLPMKVPVYDMILFSAHIHCHITYVSEDKLEKLKLLFRTIKNSQYISTLATCVYNC